MGSFHNWSSDNQIILDGRELGGKTSQLSYQNTKIDQDESFIFISRYMCVACLCMHGSLYKIKMMGLPLWGSNESSVFSLTCLLSLLYLHKKKIYPLNGLAITSSEYL